MFHFASSRRKTQGWPTLLWELALTVAYACVALAKVSAVTLSQDGCVELS